MNLVCAMSARQASVWSLDWVWGLGLGIRTGGGFVRCYGERKSGRIPIEARPGLFKTCARPELSLVPWPVARVGNEEYNSCNGLIVTVYLTVATRHRYGSSVRLCVALHVPHHGEQKLKRVPSYHRGAPSRPFSLAMSISVEGERGLCIEFSHPL